MASVTLYTSRLHEQLQSSSGTFLIFCICKSKAIKNNPSMLFQRKTWT